MNKPIILIGGAPGTGKTSLAKDLVSKLDLDHQLGAGFIREIVRAETTPERDPELFGFVFAAADPIARLKAQAERLRPAIEACIHRARDEGTSLAIDGYCLIPEVYADLTVDLYLILDAGPRLDHHTRLHGKRHTIRSLSDAQVDNAQLMNDYYQRQAYEYSVQTLRYDDNFDDIAHMIKL